MGISSSRKPICWKLNARTNTELPNSYRPSASFACTLKPGSDSSIFKPEMPEGAESRASRVTEIVLLIESVPIAADASEILPAGDDHLFDIFSGDGSPCWHSSEVTARR